jgi:GNAT superfamily N-acetyltransferase
MSPRADKRSDWELTLPGGSRIVVRPIRPSDRVLLSQIFDRLSAKSRFRRFLMPMPQLGDSQLYYLTEVDHRDHEALIALDAGTGQGVGVARYVRTGVEVAEAAVTVADDWHGRGVGTALLELLAARGREAGFKRFSALVLHSNREILAVLRRLGPVELTEAGDGALEVVVELPPAGVSPHLRELLRQAAREEAAVAPVP